MSNLLVKEVPFMGTDLMAVKDEETGKIYAGVSYICKGIGLTEKQKDNEVSKIQRDLVLQKGAQKLPLKFEGQIRNIQCIDNEFVPLWLAKISITPNMQTEQPEVADRLIQYQLKAKDVLAAAFIYQNKPMSQLEMIAQLAQGAAELERKVLETSDRTSKVETKLGAIEEKVDNKITLDHGQQCTLQGIIAKKAYERAAIIFPADRVKSESKKIFAAIYHDLKGRFGVASYRDIKDGDYQAAIKYIEGWIEPADFRKGDK